MRICSRCEQSKDISQFYYDKRKDWINTWCRDCQSLAVKKWRDEHLEYCRRDGRERYYADREKRLEYQKEHVKKTCYNITRMKRIRLEVLKIIGNGEVKCDMCGCDYIDCLEINHINGGGSKDNKLYGCFARMYTAIIKGLRPTDDLNILCRVCNARHYLELKLGPLPYEISFKG